ncbi:MAG: aquaporin [Gaiellaceae bacterium]
MEGDSLRRGTAEFVGAFALMFIGGGAIMTGADLVGVALAHGLVIAVMASAVGHISGGHFNPAVTFGFFVTRRIDPALALVYWLAQFAGATLAALLLWWIYPTDVTESASLGAPVLGGGIGVGAGFFVEAVLTFFLVWVIFATVADPRGSFKSVAGLAIGLTITLGVLMGGPLTGAAMNPSRAFGPQLVANAWSDGWIWYLGPLLGGGAAAVLYEWLYLRPPRPLAVGPPETGIEEPRPGDTAVS